MFPNIKLKLLWVQLIILWLVARGQSPGSHPSNCDFPSCRLSGSRWKFVKSIWQFWLCCVETWEPDKLALSWSSKLVLSTEFVSLTKLLYIFSESFLNVFSLQRVWPGPLAHKDRTLLSMVRKHCWRSTCVFMRNVLALLDGKFAKSLPSTWIIFSYRGLL